MAETVSSLMVVAIEYVEKGTNGYLGVVGVMLKGYDIWGKPKMEVL